MYPIARSLLLAAVAVSTIAATTPLDRQVAAHLASSVLTARSAAPVAARCDATLKLGKVARAALEARSGPATLAADFAAYDRLNLLLGDVSGEMYTVGQTSTDAAVRKAGEDCYARISDELTAISLSRPIYDRLSAIPKEWLGKTSAFTLNKVLTNYRLSGVDRDAATRSKVEALQKQLTEIGLRFDANIRDDKGDLGFAPAELEGLPADWLAERKPRADGLIHLTTNYTDVYPVLDFAKKRETRRKMGIFFRNRAHPANEAVLKQLLAKRHELARVLRHPDYATLITSDKMIGSPARVASFIEEVSAASEAAAASEKAELLAFAKTVDPTIDRLESWEFHLRLQPPPEAEVCGRSRRGPPLLHLRQIAPRDLRADGRPVRRADQAVEDRGLVTRSHCVGAARQGRSCWPLLPRHASPRRQI